MAPPSIPLWVFHLNKPSLSKPLVQEFAGASLWFDSKRADHTDPRGPGAPGPEPGAEVTNLSQNRQGVCRLSWGRSASSSSSQAASSPLSDSSGRSSSSAAPRPPSTHKRSDLPRTPVRTARTRSRVGRRLRHAGERSPRPAPRRPSPALPPFPARPHRPGSASQRAQGEGRVFPQPH